MKVLVTCVMLVSLITALSFAGNVGLTYSRAVGDQNWGLLGDYEYDAQHFAIGIEGAFRTGDIYKGKVDVSVTFATPVPVDVRLYSNNTLKGYSLGTLGRTNDVGLAAVIPADDVDIAIGIFGRNGNPFAPRTALGTLTDVGFAEAEFDGLGLDAIELAEGMSIKEGSTLNASVATEFDYNRFEIGIKGLLELLGKNERVHQFIVDIGTDGVLPHGLTWQVNADIGIQWFGEAFEYETATLLTLGYAF